LVERLNIEEILWERVAMEYQGRCYLGEDVLKLLFRTLAKKLTIGAW
jgi:hypothetical protein